MAGQGVCDSWLGGGWINEKVSGDRSGSLTLPPPSSAHREVPSSRPELVVLSRLNLWGLVLKGRTHPTGRTEAAALCGLSLPQKAPCSGFVEAKRDSEQAAQCGKPVHASCVILSGSRTRFPSSSGAVCLALTFYHFIGNSITASSRSTQGSRGQVAANRAGLPQPWGLWESPLACKECEGRSRVPRQALPH